MSYIREFYCKNPGKVISKLNFNEIFQNTWLNSITAANVVAGFRKAGGYPFNQSAIFCTAISFSTSQDEIFTTEGKIP